MTHRFDAIVAQVRERVTALHGPAITAAVEASEKAIQKHLRPGCSMPSSSFGVNHSHGFFHLNIPSSAAKDAVIEDIERIVANVTATSGCEFIRTMSVRGGSNFVLEGYLSREAQDFRQGLARRPFPTVKEPRHDA